MSTRRRILAFVKTSTERVTGRIHMLYHNGFAHDENVGQMVTAARKAGLRPAGGDGPNQTLTGPAGERLQLSTIREPHDMGCTLKGPILEVQWHSTVIVHKDKL